MKQRENDEKLKSLVHGYIVFCGKQNILLRGHPNEKVNQATVSRLSSASDGPGIVLFDKEARSPGKSIALRRTPLEAILVIFGRRALIFFCLKALGKKRKMTPLLCACAVVITLETQKCRKRAPRSVAFNFFNNCYRHKRFSQNERRRADLQKIASDFLIFA